MPRASPRFSKREIRCSKGNDGGSQSLFCDQERERETDSYLSRMKQEQLSFRCDAAVRFFQRAFFLENFSPYFFCFGFICRFKRFIENFFPVFFKCRQPVNVHCSFPLCQEIEFMFTLILPNFVFFSKFL